MPIAILSVLNFIMDFALRVLAIYGLILLFRLGHRSLKALDIYIEKNKYNQ